MPEPIRSAPSRHRARRSPVTAALLGLAALLLGLLGTVGVGLGREDAPSPEPAADVAAAATAPPSGAPSGAPTGPVSAPTPTAAPTPVTRHLLEVATQPEGAAIAVTDATGAVAEGSTPFTAEVAEGAAEVRLSAPGHNDLVRTVEVSGDERLDWWLDPAGLLHHKVAEAATGSNPKQVAFSPDGSQLWVTLLGGDGVEVFDAATGERLAGVDLGDHGAVEVIFTADGSTAYASQMESASVFEVDTASFAVRRQLPTDGNWTKVMALSPDERTLYAANWVSGDVSEIDLETGTVRRRIPTVDTPRGLYVTPDGGRLFVAGFGAGELARIDLADGSSDVLLSTGGALRHLVGDGERLYVDDMALDTVHAVDLASEQVSHLADTNEKPNTIDLSPDGRVLYVSNRGENGASYYEPGPEWGSVLALDAHTGEPLDAIVGGNQTTGLDVAPDGARVAFTDFLDNRVQVYEAPGFAELAAGDGGRAETHLDELAK